MLSELVIYIFRYETNKLEQNKTALCSSQLTPALISSSDPIDRAGVARTSK